MIFVSQLLDVCSADCVRLYLLSHHYRAPWNHDKRALIPVRKLDAALRKGLADAAEATPDDIAAHGTPFLAAIANDLDTPRAIEELRRLASADEPGARRAGRTLGRDVLGLTFA